MKLNMLIMFLNMKTVLAWHVLICCHLILFYGGSGKLLDSEKIEFCKNLECDQEEMKTVCGIRVVDGQTMLKTFDNECTLLQYGCTVDDEKAYGIINMEYCEKTTIDDVIVNINTENDCNDCPYDTGLQRVCGITRDGQGFRIRIFENKCKLLKHNCEQNSTFQVTELYICNGMKTDVDNETNHVVDERNDDTIGQGNEKDVRNDHENKVEGDEYNVSNDNKQAVTEDNEKDVNNNNEKTIDNGNENDFTNDNEAKIKGDFKIKFKNFVIVNGPIIDRNNINSSIDNFFAATHVFDLPMREMNPHFNDSTRRMLLKVAGPVKVYEPWVTIPKNISDDYHHKPTLQSCYHTCPKKCPETYAPVCGVPGRVAREPSIVFKNHCYMDIAQCKMYWENKSYTAITSAYVEASFLFCLGDALNGLYRFLPLIRTLQHMGRLKLKGKFRYKFKNMRFFNNLLAREPKVMG